MTYATSFPPTSPSISQHEQAVRSCAANATTTTVTTLAANTLPVTGQQVLGGSIALATTKYSAPPKVGAVVRKYSDLPVAEPKEAAYSELNPIQVAHYLTLEEQGIAPSILHLECRSYEDVKTVMERFPHLQSMKLTGCIGDFDWTTRLPNLRHLTFDRLDFSGERLNSMTDVPHGICPKLQTIVVSNCPKFNEVGMFGVGRLAWMFPVEQITLVNLTGVPARGINWLAKEMPRYSGRLSISDERLKKWKCGWEVNYENTRNHEIIFCSNYHALQLSIDRNIERKQKRQSLHTSDPWANLSALMR
jgi:hypothetical protein